MTFIGLSLFIASVSYIFYRHPPFTWPFLHWLYRTPPNPSPTLNAPGTTTDETGGGAPKEAPLLIEEPIAEPKKESSIIKQDVDRKAMPPPPPPSFKKPPPPPPPQSPPRADIESPNTTPTAPTFTLNAPSSNKQTSPPSRPPVPLFPAANSAQRARGPPTLKSQPQPTSSLTLPNSRSPLPNRLPPSNGLAPPPTHTTPPAKPRRAVLLTPGHSPLDWARLSSSPTANLRGLPENTPYLRVPPSLLKTMSGRKGTDAWTVLGGKVYNISSYADFHPGGVPELMRCAGKDGGRLFGEVHPWVNWEGMLGACLVGVAVGEGEVGGEGGLEEMD